MKRTDRMSNEEINEACAEALGWRRMSLQGDGKDLFESPGGTVDVVPDFCGDWNGISSLWFFVACSGPDVVSGFSNQFSNSLSLAIASSPRRHAEAFLVAMGKAVRE